MPFKTDNMDDNTIEIVSDTDSTMTYKNQCIYPTAIGKYLVNAITGIEYPFRQGTPNSLQLFKVIISAGVINENGCINRYNINKNPVITYYDSPTQYQLYTDIKIPQSIINKWNSRVNFIFPNGEYSEKKYKEYIKNIKLGKATTIK